MDFPLGGSIETTRAWLDTKGFTAILNGWKADAIIGQSDRYIKKQFPKNDHRGDMLCGLLKTARWRINSQPQQAGGGVLLQVTFQFGSKSSSAKFIDANLQKLRDTVITKWDCFTRNDFNLVYKDDIVDNDLLTAIAASTSEDDFVIFEVIDECMDFNSIKDEPEYLKAQNIISVEDDAIFDCVDVEETTWKEQIDHCLLDLKNKTKLYGSIANICEASVREHVSPVLSLAALISGEILMKAEQRIQGLHGWGPLDYLYLYKKFPVSITEVKREDLNAALAQNDAQLVSGRQNYLYHNRPKDNKKRKYLEINISSVPSYGIVTNGRDWRFRKLVETRNDGVVTSTLFKGSVRVIDLVAGTQEEIKTKLLEVVGYIVAILEDLKQNVDNNPVTKKLRNEL